MNNSNAEPAGEGGSTETSVGVEPRRASLIEVSYIEDGSGVVAMPLAVLRPGDELIWHSAMNEQRRFMVKLAENFPAEAGSYGASTEVLSTSTSSPVTIAADHVGTSVADDGLLRSAVQQAVSIRIRRDALEGTYRYQLEVEVPEQKVGVAFAGGVIIRPPPRPNP